MKVPDVKYTPEGAKIISFAERKAQLRRPIPSETDLHEAEHSVAAREMGTGLESVTNIPGAGYLGLTIPKRPDAVAALAPHAMGRDGTGHDVMVAGMITSDLGSSMRVARNIINRRKKEVHEVATVLAEKRTIGEKDVDEAMQKAKEEKPDENTATIFVITPEGQQEMSGVEIENGKITVMREWVSGRNGSGR